MLEKKLVSPSGLTVAKNITLLQIPTVLIGTIVEYRPLPNPPRHPPPTHPHKTSPKNPPHKTLPSPRPRPRMGPLNLRPTSPAPPPNPPNITHLPRPRHPNPRRLFPRPHTLQTASRNRKYVYAVFRYRYFVVLGAREEFA